MQVFDTVNAQTVDQFRLLEQLFLQVDQVVLLWLTVLLFAPVQFGHLFLDVLRVVAVVLLVELFPAA